MEKKKIFNIITIGQIIVDSIIITFCLYFASNPKISTKILETVFAILLICVGIYNITKYLLTNKGFRLYKFDLLTGFITTVLGLVILLNPFSITSILTICIGIWLVYTSIFKLTIALQLKKIKSESWIINLAISVCTALLGIIFIINPFKVYLLLSSFVSVLICCYAATDILQQMIFRKKAKEIIKILYL